MIKSRCEWPHENKLAIEYHDKEWGVPLFDDKKLFEFILLDGFQAGLSWNTILQKREAFRLALDNFEAEKIVRYNEAKIDSLLQNKSIIRNRLKINSAITNAKAFLKIVEKHTCFSDYIWQFTQGKTITNNWKKNSEIPVSTKESDEMSKALKSSGFKFVGTTICYAFMQAAGMVNDHLVSCFRFNEIKQLSI